MKKIFNNYIFAFAALFFVASCAPSFDEPEVRTSTADFSKYISIGNSLTAGFADGGLYLEGQRVAFPNLIAAQMQQVGGGTFTSPFFNENQANGSGYLRLTALTNGNPTLESVTTNLAIRGQNPVTGGPLYTKYEGAEYHNYGVPGMRLDLAFVPEFGAANPYFERLLEDSAVRNTSYLSFTTGRQHTFFSFWLGNNDVLGYAMNGAVANPADATTTLTNIQTFTGAYNNYIAALTTGDRKGVVATIPDVTSIPFFNTVTYAQLVAGVRSATGNNDLDIYIQTKTGIRAATPEDLFFLTLPRERIGVDNGFGVDPRNPIPDNMVLDRDEIPQVSAIVIQYNSVIRQAAEANDLALVDMYSFFNQVKSGLVLSSIPFNAQFIRGNAFSLDGIHLTPIGNAVVANVFIEAINKKYNASIPRVDITQYAGVRMPN
ncbi:MULTISPECIES: SGNH/GDSL hydrolase family protein [Sphingobacterium]|uniref:SGNH/GDSL hydrolase family protein n=1 Tax=Sphingobacterium populi TaxID=1812824 RepID=A0ABW5UD11_9SPHI|nr:SGNH/GDSL hydrolase family protein [Sphingobacterium sp. CFCC 11742]